MYQLMTTSSQPFVRTIIIHILQAMMLKHTETKSNKRNKTKSTMFKDTDWDLEIATSLAPFPNSYPPMPSPPNYMH